MARPIILLCCFILSFNLFAGSIDRNLVESKVRLIVKDLESKQKSNGSWSGILESDPGLEAMALVLAYNLNISDSKFKERALERIFSWKGNKPYWTEVPTGEGSLDITGTILLSLKRIGILKRYGKYRLDDAWRWFKKQGGESKFNIGTKVLLAPLKLINYPLFHLLQPNLLALPKYFPLSVKKLGPVRSLFIPLVAWSFYNSSNKLGLKRAKLNLEHFKNAGVDFGKMRYSLSPNLLAHQALGWTVKHQYSNGQWYTLFNSIVCLMALKEATDNGVHDFSAIFKKGFEGVKKWQRRNRFGKYSLVPADATGWDTPQVLNAYNTIPASLKVYSASRYKRALRYFRKNQIRMGQGLGAWSFVYNDTSFPDTDVTTSVMEAMLGGNALEDSAYRRKFYKALRWVQSTQNRDGGFPAWEKGVSKILFKTLDFAVPSIPDFSDLSQVDVTARILKFFSHLKKSKRYKYLVTDHSIKKACRFIMKKRVSKKPNRWIGRWLVAHLYGTAEVTDALLNIGCLSMRESLPTIKWLVSKQNSDGGWGESNQSFVANKYVNGKSTVMQTTYVIQALLTYEKMYYKKHQTHSAHKQSLDKAISYLLSNVTASGSVDEESHSGVIATKLWYINYSLSPEYMTLKNLGRYLKLKDLKLLGH